jgi:uncharacterized LabA/DUF88 family protein
MKKVCVFIDEMNLYGNLQTSGMATGLDYAEFGSELAARVNGALVRTYIYTAPPDDPGPDADENRRSGYQRRRGFLSALEYRPYIQLTLGKLHTTTERCPKCGETYEDLRQKGVDVRLAVDMIRYAQNHVYDVAVLVSTDGDLADAVRLIKDMGKQVELAVPNGARADELRRACDNEIVIDQQLIERCKPTK